jgi:hypothetical protein
MKVYCSIFWVSFQSSESAGGRNGTKTVKLNKMAILKHLLEML